jgi:hypothetical protein
MKKKKKEMKGEGTEERGEEGKASLHPHTRGYEEKETGSTDENEKRVKGEGIGTKERLKSGMER